MKCWLVLPYNSVEDMMRTIGFLKSQDMHLTNEDGDVIKDYLVEPMEYPGDFPDDMSYFWLKGTVEE